MKRNRAIALSLAAIWSPSGGSAAVPADVLETQILNSWVGGRYRETVRLGRDYRLTRGPNLNVDYWIGSAACRIRQHRAAGHAYLNRIVTTYELRLNQRRTIAQVIAKCRQDWNGTLLAFYNEIPAHEFWIGAAGAPFDPLGPNWVDSDGTNLLAVLDEAGRESRSAEEILTTEMVPVDDVEVAPCGPFCGDSEGPPANAEAPPR